MARVLGLALCALLCAGPAFGLEAIDGTKGPSKYATKLGKRAKNTEFM